MSFKMQNATTNSGKRTLQSLNCGTTRREVLIGAAKAGIAASVFSRYQPSLAVEPSASFNKYLIWDMHGHLNTPGDTPGEKINNLLKFADRMGIERVIVFMGYPWAHDPSPEEVRR
jgi:hypothetical protein